MTYLTAFLGITLCLTSVVNGSSILALFSSLSYADQAVFRGYVGLLASRGHNVVIMTPYTGHFPAEIQDKIIELDVGLESGEYWEEFQNLVTNVEDPYSKLREYNDFTLKLAIAQLKSKTMTTLFINPNIKFDLVVTEADVPLLYAVAEKYNTAHVAITATSGKIHQYQSKNVPVHSILYPDVNSLSYGNSTSLWQKAIEISRHIGTQLEYNSYLHLSELAAKGIFKLTKTLEEIEKEIDMLFVANNPALIGNRPTSSVVAYTDRLQIQPGYDLPQDLKTILDSAKKGAIYFSLGSIQPAEELSRELLNTLADAFRSLPYTVLWKIGNTTNINVPKNVVALDWFPQQEVLAHPNMKAFITNGGARSLEEAVFYGVPIIGLPTVRTRKVFIEQVTKHGAGEIVDPHYLDNKTMHVTISLVVRDQKYKVSMLKLKDAVFDSIISGPDHAILWTEYVLLNGGAKYLQSSSSSFLEGYLLDVLGFILLQVAGIITLTYIAIRRIVKKIKMYVIQRRGLNGKYKAL